MSSVAESIAAASAPALPAFSGITLATTLLTATLPTPPAAIVADAAMSAEATLTASDFLAGWASPLWQYLPTWQPTFMHGFICGQVSMLILLVMAIKYILFEEPFGQPAADDTEAPSTSVMSTGTHAAERKGTVVHEGGFGLSKFMIFSRKPKELPPSDLAEELAKMHKEILARTGYDLVGHGPESCDWLTVFLAQIIAKFRADAERHDRLVRVISEALNSELRPSVIDNVRITQFSLGSDFLRIASARMVPSAGSLGMRMELDLALHDELTLGFNTRVLVNWPRSTVAALPVSMVVSLVKFVGTVVVEFDCESLEPALLVSILPDYVLDFDVQTLIGSKAKVQNLPMLTSVIIRKLQAAFAKELVQPNEKRIPIKHPFTPKPPAPSHAPSPQAAHFPESFDSNPGTWQPQPSHPPLHSSVPHMPDQDSNRPASPSGPPVAELPPDYNTQLPPPHPLRSAANSRATAVGNPSASPMLGHPPRMFTPEETDSSDRLQVKDSVRQRVNRVIKTVNES